MARRGFDTESHDPPGSAVGKDSDEALHRTIQIMSLAEVSNLATEYKKEGNVCCPPRAITVLHNRVLASCVCVFGLSCINQPSSIYCSSRRSSVRQESIIGPLHQSAIDRPEFNLNQVILARDAKRSFAKTTE